MILWLLACNGDVIDTGNTDPDLDGDGHVSSEDCHDQDATVFPGADEDCDGVDDDCDGLVDEGVGILTYADLDGDGFGAGEPIEACEGLEESLDCDDDDETVNPDAEEICNDGIDNDCDPSTECALSGELTADAIFMSADIDDELGGPVRGVGDLDGDGASELALGAAGMDGAQGENTGAVYFFSGAISGSFTPDDASGFVEGLEPGDALSGVGGLGGGLVAVSSRYAAGGAGSTYILSGPPNPTTDLASAPRLIGEALSHESGVISPAGDADGDGNVDVLVTAPAISASYIALGPFSGVQSLSTAHAKVSGDPAEQVGGGVTATDTDGDGIPELILGAPLRGDGGEILVFQGPVSGALSPDDAFAVRTANTGDNAGWAITPAGDHDGDGSGDFWVSATRSDAGEVNGGAVYLVRGPVTSGALAGSVGILGTEEAGRMAPNFGDGDLDGDGNPDLAVGCRSCNDGDGAAWLFYGPVTGVFSADAGDASFTVPDAAGGIGAPVHLADFNGDGFSDLIAGGRDASAAYLFLGEGL